MGSIKLKDGLCPITGKKIINEYDGDSITEFDGYQYVIGVEQDEILINLENSAKIYLENEYHDSIYIFSGLGSMPTESMVKSNSSDWISSISWAI